MSQTQNSHTAVDMRIANFSNLDIPLNHSLNLEPQEVPAVINEIRRYADLPYGYLLASDQIGFVNELMIELKKIRSACFPYALFLIDGARSITSDLQFTDTEVDIISIDGQDPQHAERTIAEYAQKQFVFDRGELKISTDKLLPEKVDVVVVGAGVTGLYTAGRLSKSNISFLVVDQSDIIGGIWSNYANATSQVNTSEGGYRLIEKEFRSNLDHSPTREILEDIAHLGRGVSENIHLKSRVDRIEKADDAYRLTISNDTGQTTVNSKGVVLAINDRVGEPRTIDWPDRNNFRGDILSGISDDAMGFDWKNKKVVIVGMGAFAIENTRTALVGGARHVTVVGRRHGTVCPKIIDYLNFSTPYDASFKHDKKSNMRNMLLWKKLYDQSGATHPECWPSKIKHDGHTISVSDIWFIGHYLNKIETITGSISGMTEKGVLVEDQHLIEADVVVNCVGFHRNASSVSKISNYNKMYTNNYVDRDFMYLADAYIDDDAFNSFFGSSVLEMVKFYMDVFIRFFDNDDYFSMIESDGIETISIEDRKWSHYISGAAALMKRYPDIYETVRNQVSERTNNFIEAHDLETYIAANKREWIDLHSFLAGKSMSPEDCLPYVFEKLIDKKI